MFLARRIGHLNSAVKKAAAESVKNPGSDNEINALNLAILDVLKVDLPNGREKPQVDTTIDRMGGLDLGFLHTFGTIRQRAVKAARYNSR